MTVTGDRNSDQAPVLDVAAVRRDFPLLERRLNGRPIVYLDSAATSLKPTRLPRISVTFPAASSNSIVML